MSDPGPPEGEPTVTFDSRKVVYTPCPACGAKSGEPCNMGFGIRSYSDAHRERIEASQENPQ